MQQRGISAATVEALLDFGREIPIGRGCDLVFFDKRARARLAKTNMCKSYAIVASDGAVITVGHRYRRITRRACCRT